MAFRVQHFLYKTQIQHFGDFSALSPKPFIKSGPTMEVANVRGAGEKQPGLKEKLR